MDIELNKAKRQAYLRGIDDDKFREAFLDQMNYFRMQKVNLVADMDEIVNEWLQIQKKYPVKSKKK
jgi:hypothetical protein|tara:strand:- start:15 stop:212 length:198 start_codon:yes stop_codon:yes gene_type:complete